MGRYGRSEKLPHHKSFEKMRMRKKGRNWNVLDEVLAASWKMLSCGAADSNDPFHWPVMGTTGKDGVSLRCVILREFLVSDRILVCHSDARAGKIQEISDSAGVSWLFYHPQSSDPF